MVGGPGFVAFLRCLECVLGLSTLSGFGGYPQLVWRVLSGEVECGSFFTRQINRGMEVEGGRRTLNPQQVSISKRLSSCWSGGVWARVVLLGGRLLRLHGREL